MMLTDSVPASVLDEIEERAHQPTTPVSLRALYEYARDPDLSVFLTAAQFLHREMPIRLARKVKELENVPGGLSANPHIRIVRGWYVRSFQDFFESPFPKDANGERQFTEMVARVKHRHRNQVAVMARGIHEFIDRERLDGVTAELQAFLDSFYLSRIGIRVLLGHHAASHHVRDGWVGIICAQTSPLEVAQEAAEMAGGICRATIGEPPKVVYHGRTNLRFKYVPSHLRHILFELFKNSFRATLEVHRDAPRMPSVHVVIAGGQEDVSIKVSDAGGGIPRSGMDRIWTYAYTTARPSSLELRSEGTIMAGLGYGLPLSRLYARYWGGDLQVISLEGHGTDAFIHLSRLGTHGECIM